MCLWWVPIQNFQNLESHNNWCAKRYKLDTCQKSCLLKSCKSRLIYYEEVQCFTTWRSKSLVDPWSLNLIPLQLNISVFVWRRDIILSIERSNQLHGPHFEIKHCDSIDTFAWYNFVNLHGSYCGRETIGDYKTHETCYSINKKAY
jgi:hypothetical protein